MMFLRRNHKLAIVLPLPSFDQTQKRSLVNVKLKWVKDSALDSVVSNGMTLKATCTLISLIASNADRILPVYILNRHRGQLGLPIDLKVSAFLRCYPNIFQEIYRPDSRGTPVPWYRLSSEALVVYEQEMQYLYGDCPVDVLNRLKKLLMLTKDRLLPLQTIDQLSWDIGLPYDYAKIFTLKHSELFSFVKLPDERLGLRLLVWDESLAVSHLESCNLKSNGVENDKPLAFPIGFTRGFGLKKKCMEWLREWQKLPYTSPYVDASHLDPRTDVSEKRIVGVFHELMHLTILKKLERKSVNNLRKPFSMPHKFTKVFDRHPGIFYISKKGFKQTVVIREAYERGELVQRHPLADIREKYASMIKEGFLNRSRGLYKKNELFEIDLGSRGRYKFESEFGNRARVQ